MKIIGTILILWGIADLGLSWAGTDLYSGIGITLPELIDLILGKPFIAVVLFSNVIASGMLFYGYKRGTI